MRKTSIEVDEELLERVRLILDTSTIKETVDEALQEVLRSAMRKQEIQALKEMAGMDLADDSVMGGAWRQ